MINQISSERNQYIAAFIVNLISLCHGCTIGWLSNAVLYLSSDESHLRRGAITFEEASWIGSLAYIGSLFGTIFYGYLNQKLGRKYSLLLLVPPHLLFWLLVYIAYDVEHLYLARFLGGLTGGGMIRTIPLFICEISENHIRGTLGSLMILYMNFGILLSFIAGTFLDYFTMPFVMLAVPIIYAFLVLFLPDTPHSFVKRGRTREVADSLVFYRTTRKTKDQIPYWIKLEFELIKKSLESKSGKNKVKCGDYANRKACKGLAIGFFLMWLNQFSGCFALMHYTANIFKDSGSILNPKESSIIVAVICLLGSYASTYLVDRCGRKVLMVASTSLSSLGYISIATYSYLKFVRFDVSSFKWVPIASLSLVIFVGSLGILSLPFIILPEIVPQKIRDPVVTFCMACITFFAFLIVKLFPMMLNAYNLYGTMWIFSVICSVSLLIIIAWLPETRGRSLIM